VSRRLVVCSSGVGAKNIDQPTITTPISTNARIVRLSILCVALSQEKRHRAHWLA
jgi:hypothetical protein